MNAPDRVVFVTPWFGTFAGGAERAVRGLAQGLMARGTAVEVLTTCCGSPYKPWNEDHLPPGPAVAEGVPVHRFPVDKEGFEKYQAVIVKQVRGEPVGEADQYDFFTHGLASTALVEHIGTLPPEVPVVACPYFQTIPYTAVRAHPGRVTLIPAFHDEPEVRWAPVRDMVTGARGLIYLAEEERRLAVRVHGMAGGRKVAESPVLGLAVELPRGFARHLADDAVLAEVRRRLELPDRFVLYVGRKEAGKGVVRLVEHHREFLAARGGDGPPLLVAGGGDDTLIPQEPGFRDLGFVSEEDKLACMALAGATVNLSRNESFSLVIMESWLCRTPVIADAGSAVTAGHCRRSGGGIAIADGAGYAAALETLLDPDRGPAMGRAGEAYVRERFHENTVIDSYQRRLLGP